MASERRVTIELGGPTNDKVLIELEAVAHQFGLQLSEALAMVVGFGIAAMTEQGLIKGRASTPTSRTEMLKQVGEMLAAAEEFEV